MNLEIFFALIGIPSLILITAVFCYVHTGIKEEISALKEGAQTLKVDEVDKVFIDESKGGVSK